MSSSAESDPKAERFTQFWTGLLSRTPSATAFSGSTRPSSYAWIRAPTLVTGVTYTHNVFNHSTRIEVYFNRRIADENKAVFDLLLGHRDEIEGSYGGALRWQRLDAKRACRVSESFETGGLLDVELWPAIHAQMIDAMVRLERAFGPVLSRVSRL